MARTKEERWARCQVPKIVYCVRLGDHFIGKLFELLTVDSVVLYPLSDTNDFTKEVWIDQHHPSSSIMKCGALDQRVTLKKGEYFMVLDAISLTKKALTQADVECLEKEGHLQFAARWYWSILYEDKFWFFESRGRLSVVSVNTQC